MLDATNWADDRLQRHIEICKSVLKVDPWHEAARVQLNECEREVARRQKPKEPDICDLIMEESE